MQFVRLRFENDVKLYGIQAITAVSVLKFTFENDVKLYGIQAAFVISIPYL